MTRPHDRGDVQRLLRRAVHLRHDETAVPSGIGRGPSLRRRGYHVVDAGNVVLPVSVTRVRGHSLGAALGLEPHRVGRIAADRQVLFAGRVARRRFVLVAVLAAADLVPAEERTVATSGRRRH